MVPCKVQSTYPLILNKGNDASIITALCLAHNGQVTHGLALSLFIHILLIALLPQRICVGHLYYIQGLIK